MGKYDYLKEQITRRPTLAERNWNIRRLRAVERLTLAAIGRRYGISRERVRQICGTDGIHGTHIPHSDILAIQNDVESTNEELSREYNLSLARISKLRKRYPYENANLKLNQEWTAWLAYQLDENGIPNEIQPNIDLVKIITDSGKRLDVRVSSKSRDAPSMRSISNQYQFTIMSGIRDKIDFFVFIIAPEETFFVVPEGVVPHVNYVAFSYPRLSPLGRKSKYLVYQERYDLLKETEDE